jgi:hypothetical protein
MFLLGGLVFAIDDFKGSPATLPDKTDIDKKTIKHKQDKRPVDKTPADKADLVIERIEVLNPGSVGGCKQIQTVKRGALICNNYIKVYIRNKGIATSNSLNEKGRTANAGNTIMLRWDVSSVISSDIVTPTSSMYKNLAEVRISDPGTREVYYDTCETVIKGSSRKYRVTIDSSNWVDESDESNNIKTIIHDSDDCEGLPYMP